MGKISKIANKVKVVVGDNLQNLLTGLGVPGLDKSMGSSFTEVELSYDELDAAYSSDWLVGKVCDLPPFDMTREWRRMTGDMESKKLEEWQKEEKRLRYRHKIKEAMVNARIYGGCGLVITADDGNKPWERLDFSKIKKGGLSHFMVVDKQFLNVNRINHDPFSSNYGYPDTYSIAHSSIQVHHTRVIRFEGVPLPLQARRKNKYWGKSLIERVYKAFIHAAEVQENIGALIHEASVDVIRIPDLMGMIANPETEQLLQKRFGVAKIQKSVNRMLLMDADEEYEQHNQTFSGLPDLIEKYLNIVAGAADIPITRLFGQSPAGMNSTGESDLRNYYDFLSARQESELREKLEYIDNIVYRSLFGTEPADDELEFEFNSLWQMNEQEQAELEDRRATRDQTYLDMNIITEDIIARDLMERGTYSGVDSKYVKEIERLIKEANGKDEDRFDATGKDEETGKEEGDQTNADPSTGGKEGSQAQEEDT